MDEIEFYNVKTRSKIKVPLQYIRKTKYERTNKDGSTQVRHAVKADYNDQKLVKFISKDQYEKLNVPEE